MVKKDWIEIHPFEPQALKVDVCQKDTIVKLTSNLTGSVAWFNSDTTKVIADTHSVYTISNPKLNTSFYLASTMEVSDSTWNVGEKNVTTNIGNYAATVRYQIFDVFKPILLKSVLVNAYSAGDRIVELRDASGKVLQTKIINIPAGVSRVNLNFDVDPGVDYQLGLGGTNGNLGRSNAGIIYPYTIKNVISIKGSNAVNAGLQFYYSFYDWEIVSQSCIDGRQEYQIVQKDCSLSELEVNDSKLISIFPNPTNGNLKILNMRGATFKIVDLLGNVLLENNQKLEQIELNISNWSTGVYVIEFFNSQGVNAQRFVKE